MTDADSNVDVPAGVDDDIDDVGAKAATRRQVRREQLALLLKSPGFIFGVVVSTFWVLSAVAPDLLTEWGPKETVRAADGSAVVGESPGGDAWFGTDRLGRDVYSRVIHGARPILSAAPLAAAMAAMAGTVIGLALGYYRGWVDEVVGRLLEAILSIPAVLLAIIIVFTFGQSDVVIIFTVAVLFTPTVSRTVRAATLAEAQLDYVTAAKMRGERGFYVILRKP